MSLDLLEGVDEYITALQIRRLNFERIGHGLTMLRRISCQLILLEVERLLSNMHSAQPCLLCLLHNLYSFMFSR